MVIVKPRIRLPFHDDDAAAAAAIVASSNWVDDLSPEEKKLITASSIRTPNGYLSPSQIDTYLRCPQQYYHRYILGKKSAPAVALVEGTTHHATLEMNNLHKMKTGRDVEAKKLHKHFVDVWAVQRKEVEDWEGEKPDAIVKRAEAIIGNYLHRFGRRYQPEHAERTFCVPIGPVKLLGVIDTQGVLTGLTPGVKRPTIVDYKTVSRAKTEADLKGSLQLSSYSYEEKIRTGKVLSDVGFCSLLKKSGDIDWNKTVVHDGRLAWLRRVVLMVANSISLGNFPPTEPSSWVCSERFCGYWKECRGKHEKVTKLTLNTRRI